MKRKYQEKMAKDFPYIIVVYVLLTIKL